jgi:hypothetical protein
MRQSTIIVATLIRVFALCFGGWALFRLVVWATRPLAVRIHSSGHESTGFDFTDIRGLSQILIYLCLAAALYLVSLPIARAATADTERSIAFSVAFSCIRTIAFCLSIFALVSAAFTLLEIPIDHLRQSEDGGGTETVAIWTRSSFSFRAIFSESIVVLFFLPFWVFAHPLAHVLTRRLQTNQGA